MRHSLLPERPIADPITLKNMYWFGLESGNTNGKYFFYGAKCNMQPNKILYQFGNF